MTEQSGSTTSFSGGPQRGSTTIDSISHESIFCPTKAGDIFLFCRRQSRCCCTHTVALTPWVSSLVALMAQDAQPGAKNPLIQCTYPENTLWIEELFPQLWVNRPCPSICPHSAKQAVRLCLKWTMCWNEPQMNQSWLTLVCSSGTNRAPSATLQHREEYLALESSGSTNFHTFPVG